MKRIVTDIQKLSLDDERYQERDKTRPVYEYTVLINNEERKGPVYGDTPEFIELITQYNNYLTNQEIKLDKEISASFSSKKIKNNLIGLITYIPSALLIAISNGAPEVIGMPLFFLGMGLSITTALIANNPKLYLNKDHQTKVSELNKLKEKSDLLLQKANIYVEKRKIQLAKIEEEEKELKFRQDNLKFRQELVKQKRELELQKVKREETKPKFVPDVPSFLKEETKQKYQNINKETKSR